MKFNKSAESDFWYVGFDDGISAGKIIRSLLFIGHHFEPVSKVIRTGEMLEITKFMVELDKELGIDTTSTFTTNSDIK